MDAAKRFLSGEVALEAVRYDSRTGLVPVVVQSVADDSVLMVAYANREALKRTLDTGYAWFWSRSRGEFWQKGATSGNVQRVREVWLDCDNDTVLYRVDAAGPACHTGAASCFYRRLVRRLSEAERGEGTPAGADRVAQDGRDGGRAGEGDGGDAAGVDKKGTGPRTSSGPEHLEEGPVSSAAPVADWAVLERLWSTLEARWQQRPDGSYTSYLFNQGIDKVAKKLGEESVEVVIAAKNAGASTDFAARGSELVAESADLLYHLLALWKACGVTPARVLRELAQRAR
ncbi:phosphoribosyl-AMP cyclohydrolase [Alicyclobacillus kakegawensis]|uniref:phosphoribosyl-AMP cyclohydrolase n=1 Tax=Alicyclobacillus kakegawensis TaxID=392012 RepID=UPI000AFEA712|nr:phosphoribosyl-AMP cyclohydrolase [Alicyclobacillus kakegawensis]